MNLPEPMRGLQGWSVAVVRVLGSAPGVVGKRPMPLFDLRAPTMKWPSTLYYYYYYYYYYYHY